VAARNASSRPASVTPLFPAASGTRDRSREKPETRSRASTSRRTAVNIATRPSTLAMRSRKGRSPPSSRTSETLFTSPRRIQLTAVERGICNSGKSSASPADDLLLDALIVGAARAVAHVAIRPRSQPTSMVDDAVVEKASDFAKCKCVAAASQCPAPQHGCARTQMSLERRRTCRGREGRIRHDHPRTRVAHGQGRHAKERRTKTLRKPPVQNRDRVGIGPRGRCAHRSQGGAGYRADASGARGAGLRGHPLQSTLPGFGWLGKCLLRRSSRPRSH
jgi:hypothetical protein